MDAKSLSEKGPLGNDPAHLVESRTLFITTMYTDQGLVNKLGRQAYSYRMVYNAFVPLLERWGRLVEWNHLESLDEELQSVRRKKLQPVHMSFTPLHLMPLARSAPNVAVPIWEFPDLPCIDTGKDTGDNWARVADSVRVVITHTHFSAAAFRRAGIHVPVHVVPVPVKPDYFTLPDQEPGQHVVLDCPCYVLRPAQIPPSGMSRWRQLARSARQSFSQNVKPYLPRRMQELLYRTARVTRAALAAYRRYGHALPPVCPCLDLSGVVYTSIFNPFDGRKNWQDLLSAFLLALGDCQDAVLVLKLVVSPDRARAAVSEVLGRYHGMNIAHRCRVFLITEYLHEPQLLDLVRGSTYYLNTSRAEGSCLPLQDFLAAGRPALAPMHTGMADALTEDCCFPIESHPEPACFPQNPELGYTTTWHRLVWQSLHDQLRTSYLAAKRDRSRYRALSANARLAMAHLASEEKVWPRLDRALDEVFLPTLLSDRALRKAG